MAKERPIYEKIDEFNNLAKQIQEKYPDKFGGINVNRLSLWKITNKARSETKQSKWAVIPIKEPISLQFPLDFCFIVYYNDWDELSDKHKLLFICELLTAVPSEGGNSPVPCDVKGYSSMLKTFGYGYLEKSDDQTPDILALDIIWN